MSEKVSIKKRLKNGEVVIGTFVKFNSPSLVEMGAYAGFDFIIADGEHSNFTYSEMENIVRTANGVGMDAVIRVPSCSTEHILHASDMGAQGVQIPSVTTLAEATAAAEEMRYYPNGCRGFALTQRAAKYSFMPKNEYLKYATDDVLCIMHVENIEMVEKIEELCSIPQIDVIFIGPGDLSQAVGKPGELNAPEVVEIIEKVTKIALNNNKIVGIFCGNIDDIKKYTSMGIKYIAYSSDLSFIASKYNEIYLQLSEIK